MLDALGVLGGYEAGEAALEAVALEDEAVRDRAFGLAETEHHARLVKPIAALLEDKRYRKDQDVRRRAARSLSIMADASRHAVPDGPPAHRRGPRRASPRPPTAWPCTPTGRCRSARRR